MGQKKACNDLLQKRNDLISVLESIVLRQSLKSRPGTFYGCLSATYRNPEMPWPSKSGSWNHQYTRGSRALTKRRTTPSRSWRRSSAALPIPFGPGTRGVPGSESVSASESSSESHAPPSPEGRKVFSQKSGIEKITFAPFSLFFTSFSVPFY